MGLLACSLVVLIRQIYAAPFFPAEGIFKSMPAYIAFKVIEWCLDITKSLTLLGLFVLLFQSALGRKILFWASLPFAFCFMFCGMLARPLEKHKHSSLPIWWLYTILRFAVPGVILAFCVILLLKHFSN